MGSNSSFYSFFGGNTKLKSSVNTENIAKSSSSVNHSVPIPTMPISPFLIMKYVNSYGVNVRSDTSTNALSGVYSVPESLKVISQEGQWKKVKKNPNIPKQKTPFNFLRPCQLCVVNVLLMQ